MTITFEWRGMFSNAEINAIHSEAFKTRNFTDDEWDWQSLLHQHSLGWVVARDDGRLIGFVNVLWDGLVHAWLQDTMVAVDVRRNGVATAMVSVARENSKAAGCEWLHVDFDEDLSGFYLDVCGFRPTTAGLIALQE